MNEQQLIDIIQKLDCGMHIRKKDLESVYVQLARLDAFNDTAQEHPVVSLLLCPACIARFIHTHSR